MERINLESQLREERGKQLMKRLRRGGFIPVIIYKDGKDSVSLKVSEKEFSAVIGTKAGTNVIINLKIADKQKAKTVMIKEMQRDPLKGSIMHVDFNEISLTETIKVHVKVEPKGDPAGIKEGGTLERVVHEVEVECLPTAIPEKIEVDVTNMNINDTIFVKDLAAPAGIKILQDAELIVMSLKPPHVEVPAEEVPGEEVSTEPELIKKKKELEEEEAEGEAPAKEEPKKDASKEEKK